MNKGEYTTVRLQPRYMHSFTYLVVVQPLHLAEVHVGEAHCFDQNEIRYMQKLRCIQKMVDGSFGSKTARTTDGEGKKGSKRGKDVDKWSIHTVVVAFLGEVHVLGRPSLSLLNTIVVFYCCVSAMFTIDSNKLSSSDSSSYRTIFFSASSCFPQVNQGPKEDEDVIMVVSRSTNQVLCGND